MRKSGVKKSGDGEKVSCNHHHHHHYLEKMTPHDVVIVLAVGTALDVGKEKESVVGIVVGIAVVEWPFFCRLSGWGLLWQTSRQEHPTPEEREQGGLVGRGNNGGGHCRGGGGGGEGEGFAQGFSHCYTLAYWH